MARSEDCPPRSQKMSLARRTCNLPMLRPTVGAILPAANGSRPVKTALICSSTVCKGGARAVRPNGKHGWA
eukprot:scaffold1302_cov114-Isochrysis_galbana.AAC.20